jgi:hypothetical protein
VSKCKGQWRFGATQKANPTQMTFMFSLFWLLAKSKLIFMIWLHWKWSLIANTYNVKH